MVSKDGRNCEVRTTASQHNMVCGAVIPLKLLSEHRPKEVTKEVHGDMSREVKESFEELLRKTFAELYPGDKVTGIVTAISVTEI